MAFEVVFHPLAPDDLDAIDDFIARDSPILANAFVQRIEAHCRRLSQFPKRVVARDDLGDGLRLLVFERRVVIAYRIDGSVVTILPIFYAGQDFEDALLRNEPKKRSPQTRLANSTSPMG